MRLGSPTKVQVPLRITTTKEDKSGVLAGSGLQASSTMVVSFDVAKIGIGFGAGKGKMAE
jgi:hypothetical protein